MAVYLLFACAKCQTFSYPSPLPANLILAAVISTARFLPISVSRKDAPIFQWMRVLYFLDDVLKVILLLFDLNNGLTYHLTPLKPAFARVQANAYQETSNRK